MSNLHATDSTAEGCDASPLNGPSPLEKDVADYEAAPVKDRGCVESICKDLANKLVQEKVDQLLTTAAGQLQTAFDRQQEQLNASLEAELRCCRERVELLEADKEQMRATIAKLQEQISNLTALLYQSQLGWPSPGQMLDSNRVNAGMMGQFATLPSGLNPGLPMFPAVADPPAPDVSEASQPSTSVPSSPYPTGSTPTASPSPSLSTAAAPMALPPTPPMPLPPPGLESEIPGAANAAPTPFVAPPPGLDTSPIKNASAPISISAALEQKTQPELVQKAHQTPEDVYSEALMMMKAASEPVESTRHPLLQSPSPVSPGMTSTRSLASPKREHTLNLTPKRTPRLTNGKLTPGMKSPAVTASPFVICESGGSIFGFTLRKADDCSLGLDVDHTDGGNYLKVTGVKPGGAMQAWNKQCVGGPAAGKAVVAGDKIVKVNGAVTAPAMLQECREQKLLKFTVQRGEVDDDFDPLSLSSWGVNH